MTAKRTLLALLCLVSAVVPARAGTGPIVVELFTSEGCSSCPPADALLARLAASPSVLALSFHVDYWDRLGWKDPFSSAAVTQRQSRYARLFGLGSVYTPQIVVDGHWQAVGSDRAAVVQALAAARTSETVPVSLSLDGGTAHVALGDAKIAGPAAVLLVGFDRRHTDRVGGGENDGRTLTHTDVVRGFTQIGLYTGAAATLTAPLPLPSDRAAVLLQAEDGRILGAAAADLTSH